MRFCTSTFGQLSIKSGMQVVHFFRLLSIGEGS